MVFSSLLFLFRFLPAVLILYFLAPRRWRNLVLLLFSLAFYAWGEPVYIILMLVSILVSYTGGILVDRFLRQGRSRSARVALIGSSVVSLSLLGFFKYADFVIGTVNSLTGSELGLLKLALPIGISFYTFQTMSYTIDVYRGEAKVQKNLISFGAYVTMFPQLIAGPIVQYKTIDEQLRTRKETAEQFAEGVHRFMVGLGKKVLLANNAGALWDSIRAMTCTELPVLTAWVGLAAYTFQLYFDFSAYSDMAIGLGKMFGFHFLENFNYPYISKSITEFWRRWHITLSTWFREYLYIPLGGNRRGRTRQIWNLFVVWSLTGLWHGASWNFVLWGIYYFILLTIEKIFLGEKLEQLPGWLQHGYTCLIVLFGWVIFANENIADLGRYFLTMFGANGALYNQTAIYQWYTHIPLLVVLIIGSTKLPKQLLRKGWTRLKLIDAISSHQEQIRFVAASIFTVLVLYCSVAFLVSGSYNPFLYFRF